MNVADALWAAAEYIEEFGWKQNGFGIDYGPRCMIGALKSVCFPRNGLPPANPFSLYDDAERWIATALGLPEGEYGLYAYNDSKDRDANDIICSLQYAANQWRLANPVTGEPPSATTD